MNSVDVVLVIVVSGRDVCATLTFSNVSSHDAYVEKINGCLNGTIENDVFHITTDGQEVEYVGILAKRRSPGPDDFEKIAPNEKLVTRVRLDDVYKFPAGSHVYKAVYSALHTYPDRPGFRELKSNEATFSL